MKTVGAFEAKTHLFRLLERVAAGEVITITRNGEPVARLVPCGAEVKVRTAADVAEAFRRIRERAKPGGPSVCQMVEEGRRY